MATDRPAGVVICDDDPDFRWLLTSAIGREPDLYVVAEPPGPEELAKVLAGVTPEVILLDLVMPDAHGFDTIAAARRAAPDATLVVVSAVLRSSAAEEALGAGADAYVEKGRAVGEIVGDIRAALSGRRPGADSA
jgi:DNA-binding NarL/FixJ family response regulator